MLLSNDKYGRRKITYMNNEIPVMWPVTSKGNLRLKYGGAGWYTFGRPAHMVASDLGAEAETSGYFPISSQMF